MGQLTTVVPFYGLRYAAPLASAEQRWCVCDGTRVHVCGLHV